MEGARGDNELPERILISPGPRGGGVAPLACAVITRMKRQALLNSFISWGEGRGGHPAPRRPGGSGKQEEEGPKEGARATPHHRFPPGPGEAPLSGRGRSRAGAREAGMCAAHGADLAGRRVIDGARCRGLLTQSHCSPGVKRSCRPCCPRGHLRRSGKTGPAPRWALGRLCAGEGGAPRSARLSGNVRRGRPGRGARRASQVQPVEDTFLKQSSVFSFLEHQGLKRTLKDTGT